MAKRFTDTDKWKKPYIRGLQGAYKLLWLYILDDCDHAGIWQVDMEVASLRIGEPLDLETAVKSFGDKIRQVDGGEKWIIQTFIEFQYGELNPENRAHNSVLKLLAKYENQINKPLTSPLQGAMDMDKDKEKDMDKVKDKENEPKNFPFSSSESKQAWSDYIKHRKQLRVKAYTDIGMERVMSEIVKWGEGSFIESVYKTIRNNWQGLFPPQHITTNGNKNTATGSRTTTRVEPAPHGTDFGAF